MNASLKSFLRRWQSLLLPFPLANAHRVPAFLADRRRFQAMPGGAGLRWSDFFRVWVTRPQPRPLTRTTFIKARGWRGG